MNKPIVASADRVRSSNGVIMPRSFSAESRKTYDITAVSKDEAFASLAACMVVDGDKGAVKTRNSHWWYKTVCVSVQKRVLRKCWLERKIQSAYLAF